MAMTSHKAQPIGSPQLPPPAIVSPLWAFIGVGVDLMPPEVLEARHVRTIGIRCLAGIGALVVLLGAIVAVTKIQTSRAQDDLAAEQTTTITLQTQQRKYSEVALVQAQTAAIQTQLGQLMSADISWSAFIGAVRGAAPAGVAIQTLTSSVSDPNALASGGENGYGVLDVSGQGHIGVIQITGTAPDPVAVAVYTDALAALTGIAVPHPTYNSAADGLTFTMQAVVTETLLTKRFAVAAPTPGTTGVK